MKISVKDYLLGYGIVFLSYFAVMAVIGLIAIFIVMPVFVFIKFGEIIFFYDLEYYLTIFKMTFFCSLTVSLVVFNLHIFGLYDDGSDKTKK